MTPGRRMEKAQVEREFEAMSAKRVAVVVAHPDDEVLAFGGVMARHSEAGDHVSVLFLATGLAAREENASVGAGSLERLRREAAAANAVLGVEDLTFCDFPDNRMDSVPLLDVVKRVQAFLEEKDASIVYTHHAGDLNIDHQIVARSVLTACRPVPGARVDTIFAGEILSSSEYGLPEARFSPNCYVGIEAYLERKRAALRCYETEVRYWPHPRSIKAIAHLARLRGSEVGMDAAEALLLIRSVGRSAHTPLPDGLVG